MSAAFAVAHTTDELVQELVVACGALVRSRVSQPLTGRMQACRECLEVDADLLALPHLANCRVGRVTRLLVLLARAEAAAMLEHNFPAVYPPTERSRQSVAGNEPASAAVPQPRPRVLLFQLPGLGGAATVSPGNGEARDGEAHYFEPWAVVDGDIHNAAGDVVLDSYGSTVIDEERYLRRIVAMANLCEGLTTEQMENVGIAPVLPRGGVQ